MIADIHKKMTAGQRNLAAEEQARKKLEDKNLNLEKSMESANRMIGELQERAKVQEEEATLISNELDRIKKENEELKALNLRLESSQVSLFILMMIIFSLI